MAIDRVGDWKKFSEEIMVPYLDKYTISKYGKAKDFDLMTVTEPRICMWNILKYALRCWYNRGKKHDLHKICHYAQMAYTLSEGDLTKAGINVEATD